MTSMRLPSTVPPKSSDAMLAAKNEPGPVLSDWVPLMSVSTPILTTSSETCACEASGASTMAAAAPKRASIFMVLASPVCMNHARPVAIFVKRTSDRNQGNEFRLTDFAGGGQVGRSWVQSDGESPQWLHDFVSKPLLFRPGTYFRSATGSVPTKSVNLNSLPCSETDESDRRHRE